MSSNVIYTSPLCSCIVCRKELSQKGIHSHFIGYHTKEGNEMRKACAKRASHDSQKRMSRERGEQKKIEYLKSPRKCQCCTRELIFKKRINKFCSQSCAAKENNKHRSPESRKRSAELTSKTMTGRICKLPYTKVSQCRCCNKWFAGHKKTCSKTCWLTHISTLSSVRAIARHEASDPTFGGLKSNKAYGWYESASAGKVWLESSYEYKVASELDNNLIRWIRPKFLRYGDHRYFPDFYLPDFDVYLDPKNDYLIPLHTPKIVEAAKQNAVRIIILNKKQLTWNCIGSLIQNPNVSSSLPLRRASIDTLRE